MHDGATRRDCRVSVLSLLGRILEKVAPKEGVAEMLGKLEEERAEGEWTKGANPT